MNSIFNNGITHSQILGSLRRMGEDTAKQISHHMQQLEALETQAREIATQLTAVDATFSDMATQVNQATEDHSYEELVSLSPADRKLLLQFNSIAPGEALSQRIRIPLQYVNVSDEFLTEEYMSYLSQRGLVSAGSLACLRIPRPSCEYDDQDYDKHFGYINYFDLTHTIELAEEDVSDHLQALSIQTITVTAGRMSVITPDYCCRDITEVNEKDEQKRANWLKNLRSSVFNRLVRRHLQSRLSIGVQGLIAFYIDFDHLNDEGSRNECQDVLQLLEDLSIADTANASRSFVLFNHTLFRDLYKRGIEVDFVSVEAEQRQLQVVINEHLKSELIDCIYDPLLKRAFPKCGVVLDKTSTEPFKVTDLYSVQPNSVYILVASGSCDLDPKVRGKHQNRAGGNPQRDYAQRTADEHMPIRTSLAIAYHSVREIIYKQQEQLPMSDRVAIPPRAIEDSHIEVKELHLQLAQKLFPGFSLAEETCGDDQGALLLRTSDCIDCLVVDPHPKSRFLLSTDYIWKNCIAALLLLSYDCKTKPTASRYGRSSGRQHIHSLITNRLLCGKDQRNTETCYSNDLAALARQCMEHYQEHSLQGVASQSQSRVNYSDLVINLIIKLAAIDKLEEPHQLQVRPEVMQLLKEPAALINATNHLRVTSDKAQGIQFEFIE